MAYKKQVQWQSYPHLYNVTMTVGSRKAISQGKTSGLFTDDNLPI